MAEKFEIGEVAIYVRPGSPYCGEEVEIIKGPYLYRVSYDSLDPSNNGNPEYGYTVRSTVNGEKYGARPEWLRKKKPHRDIDQIVSWDDCLWKPQPILGVA